MSKGRINDQIRNLLKRNHEPIVEVCNSSISGAGNGVFSRQCINDTPRVMCLYPGIYTPGMPLHATKYLANQVPPSFHRGGPGMHENAYIMNLQSCGGYIDGWSTKKSVW